MNPDNRDRLYNNLINSGKLTEAEIGNINQFKDFVKDEKSARRLHDNLMNSGKFNESEIGTSDQFYDFIKSDFDIAAAQTQVGNSPRGLRPVVPWRETSAMPEDVAQRFEAQDRAKRQRRTAMGNTEIGWSAQAMQKRQQEDERERQRQMHEHPNHTLTEEQRRGAYPGDKGVFADITDLSGDQQMEINKRVAREEVEAATPRIYAPEVRSAFVDKTAEEYAAELGTAADWNRRREATMKAQKARVEEQVGTMLTDVEQMRTARLRELDEEYKSKHVERNIWDVVSTPGTVQPTAANPDQAAAMNDEQLGMLSAAQRKLKSAQKTIAEAQKHADDPAWLAEFGRGLGHGLTDISTWDFGITDLANANAIQKALEKYDRIAETEANGGTTDEKMTAAEQALLDAVATEVVVNEYFGSDVSNWYKGGNSTAVSIPFMASMMVSPAMAAGRGANAAMARYITKRFASQVAKKGAQKVATKVADGALKASSRVAIDAAAATMHTAMFSPLQIEADTKDRMMGQIVPHFDSEGNVKYGGHMLGDSEGVARRKATLNAFIENMSEMMGDWIPGAKVIFGNAKWAKKLLKNKFVGGIANIERRAQFHGFLGEGLEEIVGGIMNAGMVGDQTLDADLETGVFSKDNLGTIAISIGATTVFFGCAKLGAYGASMGQLKSTDKMAAQLFGDEWADLRARLQSDNMADVEAAANEIAKSDEYSAEQKNVAAMYASLYTGINAYKYADPNDVDIDAKNANDTFESAYNDATSDEVRNDIYIMMKESREKVRQTLGDEILQMMEEEDPLTVKQTLEETQQLTDEQAAALADYVAAHSAMSGVNQRINDDADMMAAEQREEARVRTNKNDGALHPATLKETDADGNPKEVFVVDGEFSVDAEDNISGDDMIVVYDPVEGKNRVISPSDIAALGEVTSAEQQEENIEANKQAYIQRQQDAATGRFNPQPGQLIDMPDGGQAVVLAVDGENVTMMMSDGTQQSFAISDIQQIVDGVAMEDYRQRHPETTEQPSKEPVAEPQAAVKGAPESFEPMMELTIKDEDRKEQQVVVTGGRARFTAQGYEDAPEGKFVELYVPDSDEPMYVREDLLRDRVVDYKNPPDDGGSDGGTPPPAGVGVLKDAKPLGEPQERPSVETPQTFTPEAYTPEDYVTQPAVEPMPMRTVGTGKNKHEEEDWMATTPSRAYQYLYEEAVGLGLPVETADNMVASNLKKAQQAVERAKSATGSVLGVLQKQNAAKVAVEYWQHVKAIRDTEKKRQFSEQAQAQLRKDAVLGEMINSGIYNKNDVPSLYDGEKLSESTKADIESILIGKFFEKNPDMVNMIVNMPGVRQKVVKALQEIADNANLGEEYSLQQQFADAVGLVYKAKNAGASVTDHAKQYGIDFETGEVSTAANVDNVMVMAFADVLTDKSVNRLKDLFTLYNDRSRDAAHGQSNLFAENESGVQTREEILKEVIDLLYNGRSKLSIQGIREETDRAVRRRQAESIAEAGSAVGSVEGQPAGEPGAAEPGAAEAGERAGEPVKVGGNEQVEGSTAAQEAERDNAEQRPVGAGLREEPAGEAPRGGDGIDIVVLGAQLPTERLGDFEKGSRAEQEEVGHHIIENAKRNGVFIKRSSLGNFGERVVGVSGESVVYIDEANNRVVKVKDPFAKTNLKGHAASDALYEHIAHNLLFPNTKYKLLGISEGPIGDVRFVLEQEYLPKSMTPATQEQIDKYLADNLGLTKVEKPYLHYENDDYSITDVDAGNDNVLADDAGNLYFVDPIIKFKKPAKEVVDHLHGTDAIAAAEAEVNTNPTEGQKKAGNYKMGHVKVDGYDITIENPKGSVRRGTDRNGKAWEQTMNNTYGYIRGTEGVDGDHIDMFLSDDPSQGDVFVVDQVNEDGSFDEHKVMYGFPDTESARQAYLSNYEDGWQGLGTITQVSKDEFKKWVESSHRKTKPFSEYKSVKPDGAQAEQRQPSSAGEPGATAADNGAVAPSAEEIRDEREQRLQEERKQRILAEGTSFDKPFALTPVSETMTPEEIGANVRRIVEGLKAKEGDNGDFEGFAYNGDYMKNAGHQVDEYLVSLSGVVPDETLRQWYESENLKTRDDLRAYGEELYSQKSVRSQKGVEGRGVGKVTKALRDGLVRLMRSAGLDVVADKKEGQRTLDKFKELARLMGGSGKMKTTSETAKLNSPEGEKAYVTVVSDAESGAKVRKNLDTLGKKYEEKSESPRTLLKDIAEALGAKQRGSGSKYVTIEAQNGNIVTIRLANHNASVRNFDNNGEPEGVSIVVAGTPNNGIENNGDAHFVEFFYRAQDLRSAEGKPLVSIIRSVEQMLYSGEYKDTTGLAHVQEVNAETLREMRAWHGSGADFDRFDHSHMGEGEGAQAYGWGTYVTEVEGIGKTYAKAGAGLNAIKYKGMKGGEVYDRADESPEYDAASSVINSILKGKDVDSAIDDAIDFHTRMGQNEIVDEIKKLNPNNFLVSKSAFLYTAEIPDDNGSNYLEWDKPIGEENIGSLLVELEKHLLTNDDYYKEQYKGHENDLIANLESDFKSTDEGRFVYENLAGRLGSDKAASEFLHSMGYVGINYPAEYMSGGRSDGAKNYVVFDEGDLKITDKARLFRTEEGEVWGYTMDGKIYIDPSVATAETPIHEYTHLWTEALRKANPAAWGRLKEEMRQQEGLMDYVRSKYPELTNEDELMDEVFAHYSGRRGAERLESDMREAMAQEPDLTLKAQVALVFHKLREVLQKFWTMARDLFAGKVEGLESMSAEDFADMALGDLLRGFDPRGAARERTATGQSAKEARDKEYLAAVERGDMETAQRMVSEAAREALPDTKIVDKNGKPLIVVHHTDNDFTKFDINRLGEGSGDEGLYGAGFYFITKGFGKFYGDNEMNVFLNIRKPFEIDDWMDNDTDRYTYFVKHFNIPELRVLTLTEGNKTITVGDYIDNIKIVDEEIAKNEITEESLANYENLKYYKPQDRLGLYRESQIIDKCGFPLISHSSYLIGELIGSKEFTEGLKKAGYDGVVVNKNSGVNEYVAFTPAQVKSADAVTYDNQGNPISLSQRFNSKNDDIRFRKAEEPRPIGRGAFGDIYDQFKGKAKEAIDFLMKKKSGEAIGALHHDEIGDIDLVWGEEGTGRSDGFGLAKLAKYHPEVLNNLQEILDDMHVTNRSENRVQLESDTHQATVRLTWDDQKKTWLLTAFEKKNSALDNTTDTGKTSEGGKRNDTATPQSTVFAAKVQQNSETAKNNSQKAENKAAGREVEKFKAPAKEPGEDMVEYAKRVADAYRVYQEDVPKIAAREAYERSMGYGANQFKEAVQDSMLSLKELYRAILGKDAKIEDVKGYENAYLAENRMHSASEAQAHAYQKDFMVPIVDAIYDLIGHGKFNKEKYDDLVDYMMAKHGLERNRVFAIRDAKEAYKKDYDTVIGNSSAIIREHINELKKQLADNTIDEAAYNNKVKFFNKELRLRKKKLEQERDDKIANLETNFENDAKYKEFKGRDYSGLTALTGESDGATAEAMAQKMVDDYEANHDTTALWKKINSATKQSLYTLYSSGMMTKERYEQIRDMFDYYIPLQGFDSTVAEDVYAYLGSDGTLGYGTPIRTAKGRRSKADDPIATIAMNGEAAIRSANRNEMKKNFLNFVQNHPSDLVSVSEVWLKYNDVTGEWEQVTADLQEGDSPADVERKTKAFDKKMEQLSHDDPDHYKRSADIPNVPYRVVQSSNMKQHQVTVKRNGKDYVLTINGNPRAAQALNGLTNPDVFTEGVFGKAMNLGQWLNRQLSAFYTTRNPEFVLSNFLRDTIYSNVMVGTKEDGKYAMQFHKNFGKMNPVSMGKLFAAWENGSLRDKVRNGTCTETERMFYDFMMNGGETGWTNMRDIEKHKKEIQSALKMEGSTNRKAWKALGSAFDLMNRSVENCARFAAFVTSREMGRSLERSIWDAKEISVNFNKKGAGDKFLTANNQNLLGQIGAALGGLGRGLYVFWNASLQGLNNIARVAKRNPWKFVGRIVATNFLLGALMPILNEILTGGDDDDDKNSYYNLPEYIRRSNLCFRFSKDMPWITIPLPIEFRAIYGLGELATGVLTGKERYNDEEFAKQFVSQLSQVLPLDFMEGGGGWHALVPSGVKPLVEALGNKSWSGLPIYKDNPYNQYDPEWTKAYKSANKQLVEATKWFNDLTNGSDYAADEKKGRIDINPAKLEYMLKGYFGGYTTMLDRFVKTGETVFGDRDFEWRNIPMASRVLREGDERTANRKLANEYFDLLEEYNETKSIEKKKREKAESGDYIAMADYVAYTNFNENYKKAQVIDNFKPLLDALHDEKENQSEYSLVEIEERENELRREMVDLIHSIQDAKKGQMPDIETPVDHMLDREFDRHGYTSNAAGSRIASRMGGTDGYGHPNKDDEKGQVYYNLRDHYDLRQDVAMQVAIKQAKDAGDDGRAKDLESARRAYNENKEEFEYGAKEAEEALQWLREEREQMLKDFGIPFDKRPKTVD